MCPKVKIRGHRAEVSITPATLLKWNNAELGESSFSDTYTVALERSKQTWRITAVTYDPIPSTEESAAGNEVRPEPGTDRRPGVSRSAGTQAVQYDRQKAAKYARYWSGVDWSPVLEERYNPDYDHVWAEHPSEVNDCTNFASQALFAGGWPRVHGIFDTVDNWDDDLDGPSRASKTWTVGYQLWRFAEKSGRAVRWKSGTPAETDDIWRLQPGDLLFADWDPNKRPDGRIDHVMVISGTFTELGFTEPAYSQHTPHRNNLPLSVGIKIATAEPPPTDPGTGMGGQGRKVVFYPVHVKDSF